VMRRGIEQMALLYPVVQDSGTEWKMPLLKGEAFAAGFDQLDFKALAAQEEMREQR
jgi:3-methyladenine DNA glycosylase Tag